MENRRSGWPGQSGGPLFPYPWRAMGIRICIHSLGAPGKAPPRRREMVLNTDSKGSDEKERYL